MVRGHQAHEVDTCCQANNNQHQLTFLKKKTLVECSKKLCQLLCDCEAILMFNKGRRSRETFIDSFYPTRYFVIPQLSASRKIGLAVAKLLCIFHTRQL